MNKYLGKSATAVNADMLDGQHGSYYRNATNLNAGTISESRLPQNAIDSTELQNGGVIDADLAGGISRTKISGTAWTHSADGYAPRAAYGGGENFYTDSTSYTTVISRTITLPASGYVYAEASTYGTYYNGTCRGYIALGFDSTLRDDWTYRGFRVDSTNTQIGVATSRIKYMSSGTHTIYLLTKKYASTDGRVYLPSYSLSAIFIDLGSTGASSPAAEAEEAAELPLKMFRRSIPLHMI